MLYHFLDNVSYNLYDFNNAVTKNINFLILMSYVVQVITYLSIPIIAGLSIIYQQATNNLSLLWLIYIPFIIFAGMIAKHNWLWKAYMLYTSVKGMK